MGINMDLTAQTDIQFIDLTGVDDGIKDSIKTILKPKKFSKGLKLPWDSGENDSNSFADISEKDEMAEEEEEEEEEEEGEVENCKMIDPPLIQSTISGIPFTGATYVCSIPYECIGGNIYPNCAAGDPNACQILSYSQPIYSTTALVPPPPPPSTTTDITNLPQNNNRDNERRNGGRGRNRNRETQNNAFITVHQPYQHSICTNLQYVYPVAPSQHAAVSNSNFIASQMSQHHTTLHPQHTVHPGHFDNKGQLRQHTTNSNYYNQEAATNYNSVNAKNLLVNPAFEKKYNNHANTPPFQKLSNSNNSSNNNNHHHRYYFSPECKKKNHYNNNNNNNTNGHVNKTKMEKNIDVSVVKKDTKLTTNNVSDKNDGSSINKAESSNPPSSSSTVSVISTTAAAAAVAATTAAVVAIASSSLSPSLSSSSSSSLSSSSSFQQPDINNVKSNQEKHISDEPVLPQTISDDSQLKNNSFDVNKESNKLVIDVEESKPISNKKISYSNILKGKDTVDENRISLMFSNNKLPVPSMEDDVNNSLKTLDQDVNKQRSIGQKYETVKSSEIDSLISNKIGEFLLNYQMDKQTVSLLPRGLTNRSNYCYINSILQALLACPPFYNLFKTLPYSRNSLKNTTTPLIDNLKRFVHEFKPLPEGARLPRKDRVKKKNDDSVDIQFDVAFEPAYVHTMLKNAACASVFSIEGRQEDAEEFLSCLLNGISDEMLELMKQVSDTSNIPQAEVNVNYNNDEEEWQVISHRNKGSITRCTEIERTPLSDIFRGQLRSKVSRVGEQNTENVQPFFTLQLDIEKADSVKTALEILVGKDQLEGMMCSKTKKQIQAWKQVTLEELPVVLILHLKWFDYKLNGCSKILKSVNYSIDLKIDNKLLSANASKKSSPRQRQYKLFAVTYHDGKEATKGHYVTDAFHVGYGSWVRYDDSSVKGISENEVLNPAIPRVPYLLYYRRCDTIGNNQSNNSKVR